MRLLPSLREIPVSFTRVTALLPALTCVVALGCSGTSSAAGPDPAVAKPDSTSEAASPESTSTAATPDSKSAAASSAWVESAVAKIRVDKGDAGGMRGCPGSLTPEAKAFFVTFYTEAAKCVTSGVKGSVTFHSTLEDGGGLSEFAVHEDKLGDAAVIKCIQEKVFTVEFPKVDPKTPCVQLVHPMTFP